LPSKTLFLVKVDLLSQGDLYILPLMENSRCILLDSVNTTTAAADLLVRCCVISQTTIVQ